MTATATKAELVKERERLAARLAEVDAQLARPVLPEGWTLTDDGLPDFNTTVDVILRNIVTDVDICKGGWAMAWLGDDGRWYWPGTETEVDKKVLAWRPIPADWLAPESREATEAEAMVKPVVKDSLTAEPTTDRRRVKVATSRLLAIIDDMIDDTTIQAAYASVVEWRAMRTVVEAAEHSVDLRGLWEAVRENHKLGHCWPTKFRRNDGTEYCVIAYWDGDIMRWVTSDTDLVSDDDAVEVLDPAKLIGGGE